MKFFKDLINEVSVKWFRQVVKEKFNDFTNSDHFEMFNNPLMNVNKADYNAELKKVYNEVDGLKTYADIFGYVRLSKLNLNDQVDLKKIQETMMHDGLKSLPTLVVKIQLGYIAALTDMFFDQVRRWQDKIGRETPIDQISVDDLKYLVEVSLGEQYDNLMKIVKNKPEAFEEIGEELKVIDNPETTLTEKNKNFEIVKIYFDKQRNEMLNNLNDQLIGQGTSVVESISSTTQEIEQVNSIVNEISFILSFGDGLIHDLEMSKKNENA